MESGFSSNLSTPLRPHPCSLVVAVLYSRPVRCVLWKSFGPSTTCCDYAISSIQSCSDCSGFEFCSCSRCPMKEFWPSANLGMATWPHPSSLVQPGYPLLSFPPLTRLFIHAVGVVVGFLGLNINHLSGRTRVGISMGEGSRWADQLLPRDEWPGRKMKERSVQGRKRGLHEWWRWRRGGEKMRLNGAGGEKECYDEGGEELLLLGKRKGAICSTQD